MEDIRLVVLGQDGTENDSVTVLWQSVAFRVHERGATVDHRVTLSSESVDHMVVGLPEPEVEPRNVLEHEHPRVMLANISQRVLHESATNVKQPPPQTSIGEGLTREGRNIEVHVWNLVQVPEPHVAEVSLRLGEMLEEHSLTLGVRLRDKLLDHKALQAKQFQCHHRDVEA